MPIIINKPIDIQPKQEPSVAQPAPLTEQQVESLKHKFKAGNLVVVNKPKVIAPPPTVSIEETKEEEHIQAPRKRKQKAAKEHQMVNIDTEQELPEPNKKGRKVLRNIVVNRNSDYINHNKG